MITGQRDIDARCWMCDLHRYSLVFWTREIGIKTEDQISNVMAFEDCKAEIEEHEKENPNANRLN